MPSDTVNSKDKMSLEELIQLRLIEGMYKTSQKYKMLDQLQVSKMLLDSCVDFIKQKSWLKNLTENQEKIVDINDKWNKN